jgi:hypothetical protein
MRTGKRSRVPSIDRGPSPRNALSDARLRSSRAPRLCRRVARFRRLCTPAGPFEIPRELGRRPRHPVASRDCASLGLGRRSPTSATVSTYGHALRAVDPRTRVGLSPRCSPGTNRCRVASVSPVRCHTVDLRAAIRSRRLSLRRAPLARTRRITGRGARAKAWFARSFDDVARALLVTPRAPGSPARFAPWSGKTAGLVAPAEIPLGCLPAKGDTVERIRVPSAATEPLRERGIAPSCAPGPRPRHATSLEVLLGGLARLFHRFCDARLLTR